MNTEFVLWICFIAGYTAIIFEHQIRVDKSAVALIMAGLSWSVYMYGNNFSPEVNTQLGEHLSDISQILLFLIAAMTIVEVIDSHKAFDAITAKIRTRNKIQLLWIVSWLTFFMSSVLDNLTTAIVMVSLLRKLIPERSDRLLFTGLVIIAANSGGAFSPVGDVTTTMLWIGGQITAVNILLKVFVPSAVSLLIPLAVITLQMRKNPQPLPERSEQIPEKIVGMRRVLGLGVCALLFAPVFKSVFHLPPYLGILLALGILWMITDLIHRYEGYELTPVTALHRIDIAGVLFFFGILMTVAALESADILSQIAVWADKTIGSQDLTVYFIGLFSAVVDNVPLVAAAQGMYDLQNFPVDSKIWEFIAYAAGTGGSVLIIGSAAGVAVMGMERVEFIWYFRKISFLAFLGYTAGALLYVFLHFITYEAGLSF